MLFLALGIGRIQAFITWYFFFPLKVTSNVKFSTCVDPFHEVKSKREKKKEVCVFGSAKTYLILFESSILVNFPI